MWAMIPIFRIKSMGQLSDIAPSSALNSSGSDMLVSDETDIFAGDFATII
jgi:hypothetical protein